MGVTVWIQDRGYNEIITMPKSLSLDPDTYSWDIRGGPKQAKIVAHGTEDDIGRILEWLRYPIFIDDLENGTVWWGFINAVEVPRGRYTIGVALDRMTNRVCVTYNEPSITGSSTRRTTDWVQDDDSVAFFGTKEKRFSMADVSESTAESKRDLALEKLKNPLAHRSLNRGSDVKGVIYCEGWLETLKWQYYSQPIGFVGNVVASNSTVVKLGVGVTDDTIGFNADKRTIHDLGARLSAFKKGDLIKVSGSAVNDDTYTVDQGTSREAESVTASTIGFRTVTKKSRIKDSANGIPEGFEYDTTVTVSGSAGNDGTYTIKGRGSDGSYLEFDDILNDETAGSSITLDNGVDTYIASTISVSGGNAYQITDLIGKNFTDFSAGDMISVSGAVGALNNASFFVESAAADGTYLELSDAVTTEAAGASITVIRGHSIKVEELLVKEYDGATTTIEILGDALRQRFEVDGSWIPGELAIKARKVGSGHADVLRVNLCADSGGNPGAVLQTFDLTPATDMTESLIWLTDLLPLTTTFSDGSFYHITVYRTGALSHTDYYEIAVDEGLNYAAGALRLRVGGAYTTVRTPDADLLFRVIGYRETTSQISDIISTCCPFIEDMDIITPSGVYTPQYRAGDLTADKELEKLLSSGTSTSKRLILTVTKDRVLKIDVEPTDSQQTRYLIDKEGELRTFLDEPVSLTLPVVGVWVDHDIMPATFYTSRIISINPTFIDEHEIDVESGRRSIKFQGEDDLYDLIGVQDG